MCRIIEIKTDTDTSALLCEQLQNEKRASCDEIREHSMTSPDMQSKELKGKNRTTVTDQ